MVHKNIVRLNISMKNHLSVHDINSSEQMSHHILNAFQRQWFAHNFLLCNELAQGGLAILEHTVDYLVFVSIVFNHVQNSHELRILTQTLQKRNFPHRWVVYPILHVLQRKTDVTEWITSKNDEAKVKLIIKCLHRRRKFLLPLRSHYQCASI